VSAWTKASGDFLIDWLSGKTYWLRVIGMETTASYLTVCVSGSLMSLVAGMILTID